MFDGCESYMMYSERIPAYTELIKMKMSVFVGTCLLTYF